MAGARRGRLTGVGVRRWIAGCGFGRRGGVRKGGEGVLRVGIGCG